MNARTNNIILPALGEHIQGGHFHGVLLIAGQLWGEVTAPKAEGELTGLAWLPEYTDVPGAVSDFDGLANTQAMAAAGSPLAQAAIELRHAGHDDWYIPARGGQLLQWGNLKPLLPEAEQFADAWHWSSTQYSRNYAFNHYFGYGFTNYNVKSWEGGRARAVRRFLIG
jgi:hypothetical protein